MSNPIFKPHVMIIKIRISCSKIKISLKLVRCNISENHDTIKNDCIL